jgi:hypothetical protein
VAIETFGRPCSGVTGGVGFGVELEVTLYLLERKLGKDKTVVFTHVVPTDYPLRHRSSNGNL